MPELLLADQVLDRAAPCAFLDERGEVSLLLGGERFAEPAEEGCPIPAQEVAEEKLGVGFRVFDSGEGEPVCGLAERRGDVQAGSGTLSFSA